VNVNITLSELQAMDVRPEFGERLYANLGDLVETILSKTQMTPAQFDAVPAVYACGVSVVRAVRVRARTHRRVRHGWARPTRCKHIWPARST